MGAFPHIQYAALSDLGRKRKNNEDSFGVFPSVGVFCVADGMGGGDDGEVASAATVKAVETFAEKNPFPPNAAYSVDSYVKGLCEAVNAASEWVFRRTQEKNLKGCGSTFVGVCLDATNPGEAVALHAGDSRLYRIRGKSIQQITKDHSAAELIGAKDESEVNPMFRGMILRAVGIQPRVEIDRTGFSLQEGDRILICSDGLSRMVPDKRILAICRGGTSASDTCRKLIAAANDAGGIDNVTAVLVDVGALPKPLPVSDVAIQSPTVDRMANDARTGETPGTSDTESGLNAAFDSDSAEPFVGTSATDSTLGGEDAMAFTSSTSSTSTIGSTESSGLLKSVNPELTTQSDRASSGKRRNRSRIILVVAVSLGWLGVLGVFLVRSAVEKQRLEEKRLMEERRLAAEEKRLAEEEAKRLAEATCLAEEKRIADEKRKAEEKRLAEEEAKRLTEEKRIADEKRKAEEKRLAEEEAKRLAEEKRIADEKRKAEEKRLAEEEAKRVAETKRLAEEKRIAEEKRLVEEEAKRLAEEKRLAEAKRLADEKRKAEEKRIFDGLKIACEKYSVAFCQKLYALNVTNVPETLYGHLKTMKDPAQTDEAKLACAKELTKEVQAVAKALVEYANLTAQMKYVERSSARKVKEDKETEEFSELAGLLVSGDSAALSTQEYCAKMIEKVPEWFR